MRTKEPFDTHHHMPAKTLERPVTSLDWIDQLFRFKSREEKAYTVPGMKSIARIQVKVLWDPKSDEEVPLHVQFPASNGGGD
jgi:hypothetical protein